MKEKIIVSLTSYSLRLNNLPKVLNTIFNQTFPPDIVELNLAFKETIPSSVNDYLQTHNVTINRCPDTKVYKKIIPSLLKYPNDCIICIDDDYLFPSGMIEDFISVHKLYPNNPISGSHWSYKGLFTPHCGNASLTKAEYLGNYIHEIDNDLMQNCPSSDIVYTYLSILNGHPYLCTQEEYFLNLTHYNEINGYSKNVVGNDGQQKTLEYLEQRFGKLPSFFVPYLGDNALSHTFQTMVDNEMQERIEIETSKIRATYAYRLGKTLIKPFSLIRNAIKTNKI